MIGSTVKGDTGDGRTQTLRCSNVRAYGGVMHVVRTTHGRGRGGALASTS